MNFTPPPLAPLYSTDWTELGWLSNIASERTQQKRTIPLLMWVLWYHVFHCSCTVHLCQTVLQHCFSPALLLLHGIMLISCLLCHNLVTALYKLCLTCSFVAWCVQPKSQHQNSLLIYVVWVFCLDEIHIWGRYTKLKGKRHPISSKEVTYIRQPYISSVDWVRVTLSSNHQFWGL